MYTDSSFSFAEQCKCCNNGVQTLISGRKEYCKECGGTGFRNCFSVPTLSTTHPTFDHCVRPENLPRYEANVGKCFTSPQFPIVFDKNDIPKRGSQYSQ